MRESERDVMNLESTPSNSIDLVVKAASDRLQKGEISSEEFDKLLNTTAKFYERMKALDSRPTNPTEKKFQ